MTEHLTNIQFALFIDGALDIDESLNIRAHLAECAECASAFLEIMSALDFNVLGLLPKVTKEEEQRAEKTLCNALKNGRERTNDEGETREHLASKVKIGLWLEEISKKASSAKRTPFHRPVLKLLQPIAEVGLASLMPGVAAANLRFFPIVAGSSIASLNEAAYALDQAHGFLVEVLAENVLRLQITQRAIKKIRVRFGENIEEHKVPASGTIDINLDTLMPKNPTNWLTDVAKKNTSNPRGLIMKEMEIELFKE